MFHLTFVEMSMKYTYSVLCLQYFNHGEKYVHENEQNIFRIRREETLEHEDY